MSDLERKPEVEVFYTNPYLKWHGPVRTPWGPVEPTLVPEEELALEDTPTIRASLEQDGEGGGDEARG